MTKKSKIQVAIKLVRQVSTYLLDHFQKVRRGVLKADGSMVSIVDRGVDQIVRARIQAMFPDDGILSEESEMIKTSSGYQWIVDSLDGTHNFLAGFPLFGMILALGYKDEVLFGICAFPALREFFLAQRGKGAWHNGVAIHVSKTSQLKGAMFLSDGNMRQAKEAIMRDISRMSAKGCRVRIFGSAPFSMTRVALGQAVVATNRAGVPWDVAAVALLVEEAGGKVSEPSGKPWSIYSKEIVATNGLVHNRVLTLR